eukprot:88667_1
MAPVTSNPSSNPTASPVLTSHPSVAPVTSNPSTNPSAYPTASPGATLDPSAAPVTSNPSADPSANPTASPDATSNPSVAPVTSSRRYEIIVPHPPYTRPLAQAACQSQYGTDLATIVSEADATEALRVANTIDASKNIWIGLNDLDTEGTYVFEDGTACDDFCPQIWKTGEPNDYNALEDCAYIRIRNVDEIYNNNMVNDVGCTENANAAMCNAQIVQSRTYEIVDTGGPYTRASAQSACQTQFGTDLATIVTEADAFEALRMANTIDDSINIWIGLNDLNTEATYAFEDGTPCYGYCPQIWKTGEPNDYNSAEDCALIRIRNVDVIYTNNMVNDIRCDHTTIYGALCNAATHREYLLIEDGLFTWSDAQQACQDRFGSDLATIITAEDAKEALRIANTASNQGLDLWIGLNDIDTEGDYVFVEETECDEADVDCGLVFFKTGEPNNYDTGEDCVSIRLRNVETVTYKDMLNDNQCTFTIPALCNQDTTTSDPTASPVLTLNPSTAPITSNPSASPSANVVDAKTTSDEATTTGVEPGGDSACADHRSWMWSAAPVTSNPSAYPTASPGATLDPSAAPVTSNPSTNPTASPVLTSHPSVAPVT